MVIKVLRVLGLLALLYVAYAAALYFLQDKLLFPGTALPVPATSQHVKDAQLIDLPFNGGQSVAYFLPAAAGSPDKKNGAMIIAHGNGELADYLVDAFSGWRSLGIALLIVEYPGYGRAPGKPGDESIRRTMNAAFDWLAGRPDIDPKRIAAHGVSLGGGAVGLLMRERPLAAVVLHATFTSLRTFPRQYGLPAFLLHNEMNTLEAVQASNIPVLVIHGKHDSIIEPEHGIALAKAANMKDFSLWDCGHGCFQDEGRPLLATIRKFLEQVRVIP